MPVKLLKKDLDFLETPLFSGILLGVYDYDEDFLHLDLLGRVPPSTFNVMPAMKDISPDWVVMVMAMACRVGGWR